METRSTAGAEAAPAGVTGILPVVVDGEDSPGGVFVQITGGIERDIAVPGQPFTLGKLQLAQALGELEALRGRGRPIVRLHLRDRGRGIAQLLAAAGTNASGAST